MDDLGFADDRPIQTNDQDLLRRSAFATNLAAAIAGWKNKESLVVALTGPWGSGKSSIKNLALRQFEKSTWAELRRQCLQSERRWPNT